MANEKVTNQELLKLRRDIALRELALAVSYPQTHTGIILHRKRTNGAVPVTSGMGWLSLSANREDIEIHNVVNNRLAERLHAAALPGTAVATPRDLQQIQKKARENSDVRVSVAKPWKKPWDK
jgi:hypothetical protein